MRKVFAVLVIAALAVACSENPTQPAPQEPQFASHGAPHGAWVQRYSAEDQFCGFWDAEGNSLPMSPCTFVSTPSRNAVFHNRMYDEHIPNPTGRAVHFGPSNYPPWLADWYSDYFGVGLTDDGLLPLCDWNVIEYPAAWSWGWDPVPPEALPLLICTTNWHYTISAAGQGTLIYTADPGHSWRPFAN